MKTFRCILVSALAAMACSCAKNNQAEIESSKIYDGMVFTLEAVTKTTVDMTDGTVSFVAGDQVKIIYGGTEAVGQVSGEGESLYIETDIPESAEGPFYAVYPSSNAAVLDGEELSVDIPRVNTGKWSDVSIMAAKTSKEEKSFAFKHVCSYVAVKITEDNISDGYNKFYLARGDDNGAGGKLFGTQKVTFGTDGAIVLGDIEENTGKYFSTVNNVSEAGDYFFPIFAGQTFAKGLLLADAKGGSGIRKSAITGLARGKVANCGEFISKVALKKTYYISADGTGDGTSWENAAGLDFFETMMAAQAPQSWLVGNSNFYFKGSSTYQMNASITTPANFMIIGGYLGDGVPGTRNPDQYITIFKQKTSGTAEPVLKISGQDVSSGIYGISFKDAVVTGASGGAIQVSDKANVTIRACKFTNNQSSSLHAGAINVENSTVTIYEGCVFSGNCAKNGGAIRVAGTTPAPVLKVSGCTFDGNIANGANGGGAVYATSGKTVLTDCICTNNEGTKGGVVFINGGEVSVNGGTMEGNVSKNATANLGGGAIQMTGTNPVVKLNGVLFKDNLVKGSVNSRGGAICMEADKGGNLMVNACVFSGNGFDMTAGGKTVYGTAIACQNSNPSSDYNDVAIFNSSFYDGVANNTSAGCCALMLTGSGLVVNSTVMDAVETNDEMVRFANIGEGRAVLYNNLLIHTGGKPSVGKTAAFSSNGYNLGTDSGTKFTKAASDLFDTSKVGSMTVDFSGNAYGAWSGTVPEGYTKGATASGTQAAIRLHAGIGEAFDTWLLSIDSDIYSTSGNGETRTEPFWPGSYQE